MSYRNSAEFVTLRVPSGWELALWFVIALLATSFVTAQTIYLRGQSAPLSGPLQYSDIQAEGITVVLGTLRKTRTGNIRAD
jgi:hypothetical protein